MWKFPKVHCQVVLDFRQYRCRKHKEIEKVIVTQNGQITDNADE